MRFSLAGSQRDFNNNNNKSIRSATLRNACQSKNLQISVSVRTYYIDFELLLLFFAI